MIYFIVNFSKFCRKSSSSHQSCSIKKVVLEIFAIFTRKHLCSSHFLIKLQSFGAATLLKETLTQVFFCEYCEIFKNTYFEKQLRTTASVNSRAAVFKQLALIFKGNALTSGICNLDELVLWTQVQTGSRAICIREVFQISA